VEAKVRQASPTEQLLEAMGDAAALEGRACGGGEYEAGVLPTGAGEQTFLSLSGLVQPQAFHDL
jgi:hypothetical protein